MLETVEFYLQLNPLVIAIFSLCPVAIFWNLYLFITDLNNDDQPFE